MDTLSWDEYFVSVAFLSSMRSLDPLNRGGACLVNRENRIIGIGYCGLPRGIDELHDDDDGRYFICHSIMNAILNKNQHDIKGARVYTSRFPCSECAKLIIQAGVERVIYSSGEVVEASKILFTLAGVSVFQFTPKTRKFVALSGSQKASVPKIPPIVP